MRPAKIFLAMLLLSTSALADPQPKIGLALSGGGARGFGHVGVLHALEELRIPVDYVAGTSIGSFMGALYASGYTMEEIDEIAAEVNWDRILQDDLSRAYLPLRRKHDVDRTISGLEIGFHDWRFHLPPSINYGRNWSFLLESLFARVADKRDFSNLPVPYRAIAMNIENGETVVLERGYLPDAVRASSALPGFFSPVEIDGKLLIDGGPVNNLPVDVLRRMGATVVIAINIGPPLKDRKELTSLLGVTEQTMNVVIQNNANRQLQHADIVITPDLGDAGVLSYSSADKMIESGRAKTLEYAKRLKAFRLSPETYRQYQAKRTSQAYKPTRVHAVTVTGTKRVDGRTLKGKVKTAPDTPLDLNTVRKDLRILNGLGDFEIVDFKPTKHTEDLVDITIRAKEKAWGPNYFRFGLNYDGELNGRDRIGLRASFLMTRLNSLGAEWNNYFEVGQRMQYATEFFQPLSHSREIFLAVRGTIFSDSEEIYDSSSTRISRAKNATGAGGVDFGFGVHRHGELRLGMWIDWTDVNVDPMVSLVPAFTGVSIGPKLSFLIDTLDHSYLPRSGFLISLDGFAPSQILGSDISYLKTSGLGSYFWSRSGHTVFGSLKAGSSFGTDIPAYTEFLFGGLGSLSGYRRGELRGQHYAFAQAGYRFHLIRSPKFLFLNQMDIGAYGEVGNAWAQSSDIGISDLKIAGTIFLGLDTKIGPVFLAYGQQGISKFQFYVTLGGPGPLNHSRPF